MHGRSIATVDHAQNIHGMDIPQGKLNHFFLAFNCRFHGIIQNVIQKDGKFRILNIIQIGGFNLIEKPNAFLFCRLQYIDSGSDPAFYYWRSAPCFYFPDPDIFFGYTL